MYFRFILYPCDPVRTYVFLMDPLDHDHSALARVGYLRIENCSVITDISLILPRLQSIANNGDQGFYENGAVFSLIIRGALSIIDQFSDIVHAI